MPSDFQLACTRARAAIVVPEFRTGTIRAAMHDRIDRGARRRRAALAGIATGLSLVAVAAAADVFGGVQVRLDPSGSTRLYFDVAHGQRFRPVRHPTDADFARAAQTVNFPVVLPTGLPAGTRAEMLSVFGPGAIQITYDLPGAWRRSNHLLMVVLANPRSVASPSQHDGPPPHTMAQLRFGPATGALRWTVGHEDVIVLKSTITSSELAHVKAAMAAR